MGGLAGRSLEVPCGLRVKAEAVEEAPEVLTASDLAPPSFLSPVSFTFAFLPQAFCLGRTASLTRLAWDSRGECKYGVLRSKQLGALERGLNRWSGPLSFSCVDVLHPRILMAEVEAGAALELRGLPPEIPDELLTLYFENHRRSGGGPLLSWQRLGSGGILIFQDPAGEEVDSRGCLGVLKLCHL